MLSWAASLLHDAWLGAPASKPNPLVRDAVVYGLLLLLLLWLSAYRIFGRLRVTGHSRWRFVPSMALLVAFTASAFFHTHLRLGAACMVSFIAFQIPLFRDSGVRSVLAAERLDRVRFDLPGEYQDHVVQLGTYRCGHCGEGTELGIQDFLRHRDCAYSNLSEEWQKRFNTVRRDAFPGAASFLDFHCPRCQGTGPHSLWLPARQRSPQCL
jgi:hypothetical protein